MRFTFLASTLAASVSVLAAPADLQTRSDLVVERQSAPVKPAPCVRNPNTTPEQTKARFNEFAQAFIYRPDISKAFSFIANDYINHNPSVSNGFDPAWNALSPIWNTLQIQPLRTLFRSPQGWVNYNAGSFGQVVDRFRWEGGCIVEHWDQGEKFPSK